MCKDAIYLRGTEVGQSHKMRRTGHFCNVLLDLVGVVSFDFSHAKSQQNHHVPPKAFLCYYQVSLFSIIFGDIPSNGPCISSRIRCIFCLSFRFQVILHNRLTLLAGSAIDSVQIVS
jgi:hypothetical protein